MKKLLALLLCLIMCLCFVACDEDTNTGETNNNDDNSVVEDTSSEDTAPVMPSEPVSDWMRGKNAEFRVRMCTTTDVYTYVHKDLKAIQYKVDDISKTYFYFLIEIKNLSSEYVFGLDDWRETPVNYYVNGDSKANFMWVTVEELDGETKGNAILDQGETAYAHYFATVEKTKIVNGGVVKGKIDGIEFEFNIQQ